MKARKLQSAKGAGRTNKLTKLVHELYFPSQLLKMLEIPSCEPLGVLNCQTNGVGFSHIPLGSMGRYLGTPLFTSLGKKTNEKQTKSLVIFNYIN